LSTPNRLHGPLASVLEAPGAWGALVQRWRGSEAGRRVEAFVDGRLAAGATVYPAQPLRMLSLTPLEQTRVVIVGQDPYHGPGQAQGLAFSVPAGLRLPPSLRNIFKELQRDVGTSVPSSGDLTPWARRGVLLMNTSLTVEDGQAASHAHAGWESLTNRLVEAAANEARPKVFMLWGAHAQQFAGGIGLAQRGHLVLQANHPSPLSATRAPLPFIGCGHFSAAAAFVAQQNPAEPLDWSLP
jgi:uracil-DNA glycosylase